jgi:uncharacterized membrane protein YjjP (DUF1212 family)
MSETKETIKPEEPEKPKESKDQEDEVPFERKVLDLAMRAGSLLVESGGEISRVEETIDRICGYYGVSYEHSYVLSNGIFLSVGDRQKKTFASVNYIPVKGSRFDRLAAVNQFSREVAAGKYTIDEASAELDRIEALPGKSNLAQILASGVGSAGFLVYCFVLSAGPAKRSKMITNIVGGMLVTAVCYLLYTCGAGQNLHQMIIGSVMPLVPGVPFINGIRDMAEGDYISGAVRMLDAVMVFASIAIGVGVVTVLAYNLLGGTAL